MKISILMMLMLLMGAAYAEDKPPCEAIAFYIANAQIQQWLPLYEQYKEQCSPEFTSDELEKQELIYGLD